MPSTTTMAKPRTQTKPLTRKQTNIIKHKPPQKPEDDHNHHHQQQQQHSWGVVRGFLLTCKHSSNSHTHQQHQEMSLKKQKQVVVVVNDTSDATSSGGGKKSKKMKCSGSLCNNTKVMHRPDQAQTHSPHLHKKRPSSSSSPPSTSTNNEASASTSSLSALSSSSTSSSNRSVKQNNNLNEIVSTSSSSLSAASSSSSFRGMPFRRLSGCYECRMVVDPVLGFVRSDPALRATICSCPHCGEIFMKPESLELHQAVRHAVSELGAEDTSKNIVEIIFQSSWAQKMKRDPPKIDRVLKVHNTQTTVANFESYRDAVKSKSRAASAAAAAATRCAADGNELLRFHSATFACSLGLNGSTALCSASCTACAIIKNGFRPSPGSPAAGILTTATSGRAHAHAHAHAHAAAFGDGGERRAMLVCRVIAGRVKKCIESGGGGGGGLEEFDSVAGAVGVYSNLDELYVFNPKAILPCFVVIYSGF